jgi:hypothetical protein
LFEPIIHLVLLVPSRTSFTLPESGPPTLGRSLPISGLGVLFN